MNRIKSRLGKFDSKASVSEDSYLRLGFEGEQKELPPGEINHVVNVGEEFNKERQESKIYRLKGTINPLFSNPLCIMKSNSTNIGDFGSSSINQEGNGLDIFNANIFKRDPLQNDFVGEPDGDYREAYETYFIENDGWFGFFDPDITKPGTCKFYDLEPTRERFNLSSYGTKNWNLLITYPSSEDTTHHLVNGGLLLVEVREAEVGGRNMVAIGAAVRHNLQNGDKVKITNMSDTVLNGTHTVKRLGLDNSDFKDNYFVIDVDPSSVSFGLQSGRMKRIVSGYESEYYIRIFERVGELNNYESYKLAFSKTIYSDDMYQFAFTEDLDIEGLVDNRGRPLSELYLTFVKTKSAGTFDRIQSGFDLEYIEGNLSDRLLSNVRKITYDVTTSHNSLSNDVLFTDNTFYGDVSEWNIIEQKEYNLTDVYHRFNCTKREISGYPNQIDAANINGPRREGYMYKPHHLIKIREFSLYVEQGDENTVGMPDYATNLGDGRYLWRDLLDIGVFDGEGDLLDYPFTNGCHYIHQNFCLPLLRQDPFGVYDLYYEGNSSDDELFDPGDPFGDAITSKYITKFPDENC